MAGTIQKTVNVDGENYVEGVAVVDASGNVLGGSRTLVGTGELQGVTAATQCPSVAGANVLLKASFANTGNVYVGKSGVTKPDGTTDTTTGIQLASGDTLWLPVSNLNILYRICDGTGDALTYAVFS